MKTSLRILITLLILTLLVWWVDPRSLFEAVQTVRMPWLLLMALFVVLFVVVGIANSMILTLALEPGIDKTLVAKGYLRSFALGMLGPSKIGELSYSHYISKAGVSHGLGLAVLVVDKGVTFSLSALAGSLTLLYFVGREHAIIAAVFAAGIVAAAAATFRSERLRRSVRRKLLGPYERKFFGFSSYVVSLMKEHRLAVAADACLTLVRMSLQAAAVWFGFHAFRADVDFLPVVGILALIQLISWIPITFSGLGLTHGSAVLLFSAFHGVAKAIVLDLFLLLTVVGFLLALAVLSVFGYRSEPSPAS